MVLEIGRDELLLIRGSICDSFSISPPDEQELIPTEQHRFEASMMFLIAIGPDASTPLA